MKTWHLVAIAAGLYLIRVWKREDAHQAYLDGEAARSRASAAANSQAAHLAGGGT